MRWFRWFQYFQMEQIDCQQPTRSWLWFAARLSLKFFAVFGVRNWMVMQKSTSRWKKTLDQEITCLTCWLIWYDYDMSCEISAHIGLQPPECKCFCTKSACGACVDNPIAYSIMHLYHEQVQVDTIVLQIIPCPQYSIHLENWTLYWICSFWGPIYRWVSNIRGWEVNDEFLIPNGHQT